MSNQHSPYSPILGSVLSSSSSSSAPPRPTAPQLLFDDGSRVIQEAQQQTTVAGAAAIEIIEAKQRSSYAQTRGSLPLVEYYEINCLVNEIQKLSMNSSTWRNRIALQFPDELLVDSPDVCWELEQALLIAMANDESNDSNSNNGTNKNEPLVFCLGDTTYQSCCPDLVAAAHLQADCLIHFGHACLSNHAAIAGASKIPVIYSFGRAEIPVELVAQQVLMKIQKSTMPQQEKADNEDEETMTAVHRILLLSEVRYVYAMEQLQERLTSDGNVQVAIGRIPENRISLTSSSLSLSNENENDSAPPPRSTATACGTPNCCQNVKGNNDQEGVCQTKQDAVSSSDVSKPKSTEENLLLTCKEHGFIVGGLELPLELDTWTSPFTLLFVGNDESRQYLNIVLRFLSSSTNNVDNSSPDHHQHAQHQQQHQSPTNYWTWNPTSNNLSTQLSPRFKRQLNRRFYLVQKARMAKVFGLLVANLSDIYMQSVVHSLRSLIEQQNNNNKACYTFVVGKINPAKISNFAEIDCFVMVACPEHSLLLADEEREYPVPIITPLELTMALGLVEWGTVAYSLDSHDYLLQQNDNKKKGIATTMGQDELESDNDDEDSDAPYFNPVTGRYESSVKHQQPQEDLNLAALPGHGTLTKYTSAAVDFLKQREYQGLQVNAGETKVEPAIAGQQGIASNYGER